MMDSPVVSVIIPCRNEELFIEQCLLSLLKNDFPHESTEILVIDGESEDNTGKILEGLINSNRNIRVISNPGKTFPKAVNTGIRQSRGDFVLIAGAHATYPYDYISNCIKEITLYNADNVGGVLLTLPYEKSHTAELITEVLSNPFGVGNSKFRTGSKEPVETDTVFGGCYRRDVFNKYGLFNENLVSTSDYEFNRRIKRSGAKIMLIPNIVITYYTRSTLSTFLQNNFRNGYWAIFPIAFTDHFPVSVRHLVPLIFSFAMICLAIISFINSFALILLLLLISVYFMTAIVFTLRSAKNKFRDFFSMPLLFFGLHFIYGLGSIYGFAHLIRKKMGISS